jgi:hypothetical protein
MAGYVWLFINYNNSSTQSGFEVCIVKHVTNIPCPSCGATRSAISAIHGNFLDSLTLNPIGLILLLIMIVSPLWITFDFLMKKNSFIVFYTKAEKAFQQKRIAIPSVLLILSNWVWNIYKDL